MEAIIFKTLKVLLDCFIKPHSIKEFPQEMDKKPTAWICETNSFFVKATIQILAILGATSLRSKR